MSGATGLWQMTFLGVWRRRRDVSTSPAPGSPILGDKNRDKNMFLSLKIRSAGALGGATIHRSVRGCQACRVAVWDTLRRSPVAPISPAGSILAKSCSYLCSYLLFLSLFLLLTFKRSLPVWFDHGIFCPESHGEHDPVSHGYR